MGRWSGGGRDGKEWQMRGSERDGKREWRGVEGEEFFDLGDTSNTYQERRGQKKKIQTKVENIF